MDGCGEVWGGVKVNAVVGMRWDAMRWDVVAQLWLNCGSISWLNCGSIGGSIGGQLWLIGGSIRGSLVAHGGSLGGSWWLNCGSIWWLIWMAHLVAQCPK